MKTQLAGLAVSTAFLPSLASADGSEPLALSVQLGGAFAPGHVLALKDGTLTCTQTWSDGLHVIAIAKPTESQWRDFRSKLDRLNVWSWRPNYVNKYVLDGLQWHVEVKFEDKSVVSGGSNSYPGINGRPVPTSAPVFDQALAAFRDLMPQCPL